MRSNLNILRSRTCEITPRDLSDKRTRFARIYKHGEHTAACRRLSVAATSWKSWKATRGWIAGVGRIWPGMRIPILRTSVVPGAFVFVPWRIRATRPISGSLLSRVRLSCPKLDFPPRAAERLGGEPRKRLSPAHFARFSARDSSPATYRSPSDVGRLLHLHTILTRWYTHFIPRSTLQ